MSGTSQQASRRAGFSPPRRDVREDGGLKPTLRRVLDVLRAELEELLGAPVDLAERSAFRPAVREAAEQEAVPVF